MAPTVPRQLSELVMRMLARERAARPSNLAALLEELCRFEESETEPRSHRRPRSRNAIVLPLSSGQDGKLMVATLPSASIERPPSAFDTTWPERQWWRTWGPLVAALLLVVVMSWLAR